MDLTGRVGVVSGGASGIGRATALLLAQQGAKVFAGYHNYLPEDDASFAAAGIVSIHCDVRREQDVRELIERAVAEGGAVDILVNNAGINMVKQIPDVTVQEWDACLDTNLRGAFLGAKNAIGSMREHGGGSSVNVSSNAGLLPCVDQEPSIVPCQR